MPPYSDNLYSVDDSDNESLSDQLSPTDGYFSNREHPQDIMIEDPSVAGNSSTAESKAQEARRESESNTQTTSTPSPMTSPVPSSASPSQTFPPGATAAYVSSSPPAPTPRSPVSSHRRSIDAYTEGSSLLHPVPPPAYSPATSPVVPSSTTFNRNYNTITNSQLEEGRVPHREPESMGGPPQPMVDETTPLWRRRVKITRTRGCIKGCLLILLVLTVFVSLLVTLIRAGLQTDGNFHPGQPNKPSKPVAPVEPGKPAEPVDPGAPISHNYCSTATIHKTHYPVYEFQSGGAFNLLQTHKDEGSQGHPYVQTAGRVVFRRHNKETSSDRSNPTVTFDVWTTDDDLSAEVQLDADATAIKAYTPQHQEGLSTGTQHCISLEITVWLPGDATFEQVKVFTSQLDVDVYDNIHVHVSHSVEFETVSGHIRFPAVDIDDPTIHKPSASEAESRTTQLFRRPERGFTSREVRIHTASGSVTGAFSLYDLLSINTFSGHIDVSVAPQEADKNKNPAVLELESRSGNVNGRLPVYANPVIPRRDYHTSVTTLSGSIHGSYYIGSEATIKTTSASIEVALLPGLSDGKANLRTETYSGHQSIKILSIPTHLLDHHEDPNKWIDIGESDPYLLLPPPAQRSPASIDKSKAILKNLYSIHKSQSGSHDLLFPSEWEGMIEVQTMSGSIKVGGDGVKVINDGRSSLWLHRVLAEKGERAEKKSSIQVSGYSGSVKVDVGLR